MLGLFPSYFSSETSVRARKQSKPNYIYRDELDKKNPTTCEAKPLLQKEKDEKKKEIDERENSQGRIRVKVLMTKEEATRLLSKCKDGGVLDFKDVAKELVKLPSNRVSVVSSSTSTNNKSTISDHVLKTIPEEL